MAMRSMCRELQFRCYEHEDASRGLESVIEHALESAILVNSAQIARLDEMRQIVNSRAILEFIDCNEVANFLQMAKSEHALYLELCDPESAALVESACNILESLAD